MREVDRQEVLELLERGAQVVEVLPADEFEEEHLPGAINLPLRKIETDASSELKRDQPVLVYCWDSA
jgi:rhodanese-related sulfurtransferase